MAWFDNTLVLRDFADALVKAEYMDDSADIIKRPYRFTNEYNLWKRNEFPSDETENGWDGFVAALDDLSGDDDEEEDEPDENE